MFRHRASPPPPNHFFSDIANHWAAACIAELVEQGWITGSPASRFRPDDPMTRAEFAALMYWVFPDSLPVRKATQFIDVPDHHWASRAVKWSYERGFFSGSASGFFRPDANLSRVEALLVLTRGLHYVFPLFPVDILKLYFDDADDVHPRARGAIAAATLAGLIANYPDVRKLRPRQVITRGEVAAVLCQVKGRSHTIASQYIVWGKGLEDLPESVYLPFHALQGNARLIKQIQTKLHDLRLHPDAAFTGKYTPATEAALIEFCRVLELPNRQTYVLDYPLAQLLFTIEPVCFLLTQAQNREKVFQEYFNQEKGFNAAALAFLDKGIQGSPYSTEIQNYPTYLQHNVSTLAAVLPEERSRDASQNIVAMGRITHSSSSYSAMTDSSVANELRPHSRFTPFPQRGQLPHIDPNGLAFLHDDIQQACVCVGKFVDGTLQTAWLGRNALQNVELWSATKIIPLLNLVSKVNTTFSDADIDDQIIRPGGGRKGFKLYDLAVDMINYKSAFGSSNSLAAMFKQFETPQNLENWLKQITGNKTLVFRGRYGEGAFISAPELWDQRLQKIILRAQSGGQWGSNTISTYDLTRLITMLAWHLHLPPECQLPHAQWNSLESIIRAMGKDSARYLDVAIAQLGLTDVIQSPVIISKLGFGRSGIRHRTELVYTAFIHFLDTHGCGNKLRSPQLRSAGITLIGAKKLGHSDREATELDARIAAEITELLRRIVTEELVTEKL